jgi:tetratricopeptide (TPR) repeat protein
LQAYRHAVQLTLAAGRYPCQAIDDMDVAIKLLERSRVVFTPLVTRAVSLRAQGRLDEALTDLKKALSRRPSDIPTMLLLGQVHTRPPTHAPLTRLNSTHALRRSHDTPVVAALFPAWAESKAERKRLREAERK